MKKIIQSDTSGRLLTGVFFQVDIPTNLEFVLEFSSPGEKERWIVSPSHCTPSGSDIYAEGLADQDYQHKCPLHKSHVTGILSSSHRVDLFGGKVVCEFVGDSFGGIVIVRRDFCDRLMHTGFIGLSGKPLPVSCNQCANPSPDLFRLEFLGADCVRPDEITIPDPNVCPFCGWGPVVCPACREVFYSCGRCKEKIIIPEMEWQGPGDKRFVTEPTPEEGWVLAGRLWDGSDFLRGLSQGIVSKRVVDWIVREKAGPFIAQPCRIDIAGMDQGQLDMLESITGGKIEPPA